MNLSTINLDDPNSITIDDGQISVAFFCINRPVRIDWAVIEELKKATMKYGGKNARICLHCRPEDHFHNMIILENKGKYYRPHKHTKKGDCLHIIDGEIAIFTFDADGGILDAIRLSPQENLIYRVEDNMYHTIMPLTQTVIYHESKPGPFLGDEDKIYPDWAPDGTDDKIVADYNNFLLQEFRRISS